MDFTSFINKPLWNCLTCNMQIDEFEYDTNNGTCDGCPRLTTISEVFLRVIRKKAAEGDFDAMRVLAAYE